MGKRVKPFIIIVIISGIGIQVYRPELPMPEVTQDLVAPAEVKQILRASCYDCHSNETNLAWFDHINPAYWLVRNHVLEARRYLNFSHWDSLSPKQRNNQLFDVLNVVDTFRRMPKPEYQLLHPKARLSEDEITVLREYIRSLEWEVPFDSTKWENRRLARRAPDPAPVPDVAPTINGIEFIPEYRHWPVISITDRFDNSTMRVIMANPVAQDAIRRGETNPYPDGSILAKILWERLSDPEGRLIPGRFIHVEFMIRDSQAYADTKNWGWARWTGNDLKPFGRNKMAIQTCVNCHVPMKSKDFVFTTPLTISTEE